MLECFLQAGHKRRSRCDAIAVEATFRRQRFPFLFCLFDQIGRLFGRSKSAATLLIHFGAGRHTIHGHEKQFLRLNQSEQRVNVAENVTEYLLLGDAKVYIGVIGMRAHMDDSIHVQVHVIELWQL